MMLPTWQVPDDRRDDDLVVAHVLQIPRGPRAGTYLTVAPWGRRAAAAAIDDIPPLLAVLAGLLVMRTTYEDTPAGELLTTASWVALGGSVVAALLLVALNTLLVARRSGQTLGKRIIGLRLVDTRTGEPLHGWAGIETAWIHDSWVWRSGMTAPEDHAVLNETAVVLAR